MKTKREVLERFAEKGYCAGIFCSECAYLELCGRKGTLGVKGKLQKIGAMAVLRMFPEKKKPLLSFGTKIKFNDGNIAKIEPTVAGPELIFNTIDGYTSQPLSYLLGKTWEVVE